ncbi:MAG TPA: DUF4387 family protein [Acidimicrobiales bacterium]|nr:DUF4387 family protein [Acidimicrobiales bacterium]
MSRPIATVASFRSKNAGPFTVTIDIFFDSADDYRQVRDGGQLRPETVAPRYDLDPEAVSVYFVDSVSAAKVSLPRRLPGGDPDDTDVCGGQMFVPLLSLSVEGVGRGTAHVTGT